VVTDAQAADSKPGRKARRWANKASRNARDYGSESWRGRFVDVLCDQCRKPIVTDAHPGEWWPLIREVAPLIDCGDQLDPNGPRAGAAAALIRDRGAMGQVSQHGIMSGFVGGLWVLALPTALGGRYYYERMTVPGGLHHLPLQIRPVSAGINGDAVDHCVIGAPTIIRHRCGAIFTIELYQLISRVEAAIQAGKEKLYLRTDQLTTAVSTASVKR
jgi:hypothetical protein